MDVGDHVHKTRGYPFPGVVVAVFRKLDGQTRVVVESSVLPGLLHLYAPDQLVRESEPGPEWTPPDGDEIEGRGGA